MTETTTVTIADWLLGCIKEDATVARGATRHERGYDPAHEWFDNGRWRVRGSYGEPAEDGCRVEGETPDAIDLYDEGGHTHEQAVHIARHDPAHALAVCAAHRRIVDEALSRLRDAETEPKCEGVQWAGTVSGDFLRALALAYADRPGWREDWRP